jgi:signal transduction histidine kinase
MVDQHTTAAGYKQLEVALEVAVEALQEGFALFSADSDLVYCNGSFRRQYTKLNDFLKPGLNWQVFLHEAQRLYGSSSLHQLDNHLQLDTTDSLVVEAERTGGQWVRSAVHPMQDGGFVLTEAETTEQHQAMQNQVTAMDALHGVLDGCASRIALIDADIGRILYRTPAWKQTFGAVNEIAQSFHDPLSYADLLTDILPTGSVDDLELSMYDAQACVFPARLSARLIDYQSTSAIVLSAEDLTDLHAQREEILRTTQRLFDAIEALDQGFALFDTKSRLVTSNRLYKSVNSSAAIDFISGPSNAELTAAARKHGHNPAAIGWDRPEATGVNEDYEFSLPNENFYSASRRATSDGGFVLTWRDITQQRAMEKELNAQREAMLQSEKLNALGQLLAGVAHELNNPLSVVVGHAMMLRDELQDEDALDSVDRISRSAERCVKIVKTFLAMARREETRLVQTSINDVVELSMDIAAYTLRKNGVTVDRVLADELPDVMADEDQLAQVLVNLMINAEQACSDHTDTPTVQLSTRYDPVSKQVQALVSDNGPGVPEDLTARIFEPFFSTKAIGKGTGIGLSLCHRIAESHSGSIALADSELGGAAFVLSLPVVDDTADAPDTTPDATKGI